MDGDFDEHRLDFPFDETQASSDILDGGTHTFFLLFQASRHDADYDARHFMRR
jgi:hypothetical protein